jgi:hypothetical protein
MLKVFIVLPIPSLDVVFSSMSRYMVQQAAHSNACVTVLKKLLKMICKQSVNFGYKES